MQTAEPTNANCYKPSSKETRNAGAHSSPPSSSLSSWSLPGPDPPWREFSAVLRTPCRHSHLPTAKARVRDAGGDHTKASFLSRGTGVP